MSEDDWTNCPICGSVLMKSGMGGHKGTKICYYNADGKSISKNAIIVDSDHRPEDLVCVLCRDPIDEDEKAVLIRGWAGSSKNGKPTVNYFHFKHVRDEIMARLMKK